MGSYLKVSRKTKTGENCEQVEEKGERNEGGGNLVES